MKLDELIESPVVTSINKEPGTLDRPSMESIQRNSDKLGSVVSDNITFEIWHNKRANQFIYGIPNEWNVENKKDSFQIVVLLQTVPVDIVNPLTLDNVNTYKVQSVDVDSRYESKNNASLLYEFLVNEADILIVSDNKQRPGGKALWKKLVRRGHIDVYIYNETTEEYLAHDREGFYPIKYDGKNLDDKAVWSNINIDKLSDVEGWSNYNVLLVGHK